MTLPRLPLLLAFSALTACAMAGDNLSSSQATSAKADVRAQKSAPLVADAENLAPDSDIAPRSRLLFPGPTPENLVFTPDANHGVPPARFDTRDGLSLANVHGDVCYTLRTYKVKPTERIRDHENPLQGYSECEMASDFHIRSAEAHQKKPAARLK